MGEYFQNKSIEYSTRILALVQVLNGGTDVFRCIAAEWKGVDPDSVNDTLRQQAKQVQLDGTQQIGSPSRTPADCWLNSRFGSM